MILGLPVVTTNCSGMEELLDEGLYGLLVDNNENALYEGIKKIILDDECLDFYRFKAEERGCFFSLERTMNVIKDLL